jgi:hypothetical protein
MTNSVNSFNLQQGKIDIPIHDNLVKSREEIVQNGITILESVA